MVTTKILITCRRTTKVDEFSNTRVIGESFNARLPSFGKLYLGEICLSNPTVKTIQYDPDYDRDVDTRTTYTSEFTWLVNFTYELNDDGYVIMKLKEVNSSTDKWGDTHYTDGKEWFIMLRGESRLEIDLDKVGPENCFNLDKRRQDVIISDKVVGNGEQLVKFKIHMNSYVVSNFPRDKCVQKHHFEFYIELDDKDPGLHIGPHTSERSLKLTNYGYLHGFWPMDFIFNAKIHPNKIEKTKGLFKKRTEVVSQTLHPYITLLIDGKPVGKKKRIKIKCDSSECSIYL